MKARELESTTNEQIKMHVAEKAQAITIEVNSILVKCTKSNEQTTITNNKSFSWRKQEECKEQNKRKLNKKRYYSKCNILLVPLHCCITPTATTSASCCNRVTISVVPSCCCPQFYVYSYYCCCYLFTLSLLLLAMQVTTKRDPATMDISNSCTHICVPV